MTTGSTIENLDQVAEDLIASEKRRSAVRGRNQTVMSHRVARTFCPAALMRFAEECGKAGGGVGI
ncbi:MAG: hypothetical protein MI755_16505 [Sphingomonadales bacterium]|nr:hypothetical protein [Sphingomonadales bacterium]